MFRIEFFVDDKNLGEAFKRLAGIARNVSHAYVPNVETKRNGKMTSSASDSVELIMNEFRKRKVTEVNADVARSVIGDLGFNPNSYSYFLHKAIKLGLLSKGKKIPGKSFAMSYALKGEK